MIYDGSKFLVKGCHNKGTRVILSNKKSVLIQKVEILKYAGGVY